jgi:hypothetical protein
MGKFAILFNGFEIARKNIFTRPFFSKRQIFSKAWEKGGEKAKNFRSKITP